MGEPPQISLPRGGGAVHGLGETFRPDLQTGTGNYGVPLDVPPGRNGLQPTLSLSYSTGNPNGPFGLGWSLGIPGVQRRTSRGLPRYDGTDVFVLSGSEDLVPVPGGSGGRTRHRPRSEAQFARIERITGAGTDHWEVRSRDGLRSVYGTARPPGAADGWRDPAAVTDPAEPRRVFAWMLSETVDPFGNRIAYRYERDPDAAGYDQLYLADIRYVDHGDPQAPEFLVRIAFLYEPRPDPGSDRRAGFEVRTTRRCVRIETWLHHADQPVLARTVDLGYTQAAGNALSLLTDVRVLGHDGDQRQALPPLQFGYTGFTPDRRRLVTVTADNGELPVTSLADPDLALVDLFGTGLPSVLQMNGAARVWRNGGNARLRAPRPMTAAPGVALGDPGVQLADMDGDGRADLLVATAELAGHYPLTFDGRFDEGGFIRHPRTPAAGLDDPRLRLIDLDGDGVIDAMRTAESVELYLNEPGRGFNRVERRPAGGPGTPPVSFDDPRVVLADMSGDGLTDIVLVQDRSLRYWPHVGHGRFGAPVDMAGAPHFGDPAFDPARVLVGDIDGDGCADVLYVGDGHVTVWLNQSGVRFAEPVTIRGTPAVREAGTARLVDLLGTGTAGVLWSADAGTRRGGAYKFLDLTGGVKPYLLQSIDNHMGARTTIGYAPSTDYLLADERAGRPWRTTLPFPVQVVARTTVDDQFSGTTLTSEFHYHHGHWDGAEREFRGFARVDQLDTSFLAAGQHPVPPTEHRTWFHIGPVGPEHGDWAELDLADEYWHGDPDVLGPTDVDLPAGLPRRTRRDVVRALRGAVLRTELYALDGDPARQDRPYTVTEHRHRLTAVLDGRAAADEDWLAAPVAFAHQAAERTTQWERGDDPMHRLTFTGAHDGYGLPDREIAVAVPRGRDFRTAADGTPEPYLGTSAVTTYARRDDADHYIVDRVATTTTSEIRNDGRPALSDLVDAVTDGTAELAVVAEVRNHYDGDAFEGLPLGVLGDFGAPVRSRALVLTGELVRRAYGPEPPPYLTPDGPPAWMGEYPDEFRTGLPPLAGHSFVPGDGEHDGGYFTDTSRQTYDVHGGPGAGPVGRGLVTAVRDPMGRDTTIGYDRFQLLPAEVIDPAGLRTEGVHDYRVLQPSQVTDPNGNRNVFTFTPLGFLASIGVCGRDGEPVGDTAEAPGTRLVYDLSAADEGQPQPVSVRTIRRVHHVTDLDIPLPQRDDTTQTVEYSDGFGRLIQTRALAEDVVFGDPTFGGGVLPADQGDPGAQDAVTGRRNDDPARPNVVVSGWQVYDAKGRVIETYEPFFAIGWAYQPPTDAQLGRRVRMMYDPRGRILRTVHPDGSEHRVVPGVPLDLADPERCTPTPWEAYTYDGNDNAGRTHPGDAGGYAHHWNTPASILVDALGRTVLGTERHRTAPSTPDGPLPPIEELHHRSEYDIRGNVTRATDPLGRVAFRVVYDLANHPLRRESIDAGVRRTVLDAGGNDVEYRDSKGALVLRRHDVLGRVVRQWARDEGVDAVTLRQRMEYGDGGDPAQPAPDRRAGRAANRLGALHRQYDEAGLLTFASYDFKGNAVDKIRQVISDEAILAAFPTGGEPAPDRRVTPFRVDWEPPVGSTMDAHARSLLDPTRYEITARHDAMNRATVVRYPRDVDGDRKELRASYNRAGALERVSLDGEAFVDHIAYNAKGQRTLMALANGLLTRYAHHPTTMRLARLRSERSIRPASTTPTYRPDGAPLQDLAYQHDLVGNITVLVERTAGCGIAANPDAGRISDPELRDLVARGDAMVRRFDYDSLYRLTSATGRECRGGASAQVWRDVPGCGFNGGTGATPNHANAATLTGGYRERYGYDPAGNLIRLRRATGAGDAVRLFTLDPGTNRLRTLTTGATTVAYAHDANGNVTGETTSRHFEWDQSDQLRAFRIQAGTAEPSVHAQYLYDAGGQRVKKLVRKQGGGIEVATYVDGIFEHHHRRRPGDGPAPGTDYLHVMDDRQRLALVRLGTPHPDDKGPAVQHHLSDHLGSSSVVVGADGGFVNREEYTPYGETSFGSFGRKRYRFTGAERDEESGLAYHGARYYAPWLARWRSCDPAGPAGGANLYAYAQGNPVVLADPGGMQPRSTLIDADDAPEPPPTLTLPTVDPQVELETGSGGPRTAALSEVLASPGYIDNYERFEARPDPLTLHVSEVTFYYAGGNALRVPMASIDPAPGSRASRYKASAGLVVPLGPSGEAALNATNTPAISAAAGYIYAEIAQRHATRVEMAEMAYAFAGAIRLLGHSLTPLPPIRLPMPGRGLRQLPLSDLTEAEINAAVNSKMSSRYFYRTPVSATQAGHPLESMVPTSRWGRPGLRANDWIMGGPPNRYNWLRSGKWDPNPTNIRAPYRTGEGYMLPRQHVTWPRGPFGWIKGLFGQRKYTPTGGK